MTSVNGAESGVAGLGLGVGVRRGADRATSNQILSSALIQARAPSSTATAPASAPSASSRSRRRAELQSSPQT